MEANHKLSIKYGSVLDEEKKGKYQLLVEKLVYLTLTRPYITYIVNVVNQFTDVERILCCLERNPSKGFLFMRSKSINIEGYSNVDVLLPLRDLSQKTMCFWGESCHMEE